MLDCIKRTDAEKCIKDYLKELIDEGKENVEIIEFNAEIQKRLAEVPAEDVAEVKHGEWVEQEHGLIFVCSACNYPTDYKLTTYCPLCGARMDLKEGAEYGNL